MSDEKWSVGGSTGKLNQIQIEPCIAVVYGSGQQLIDHANLISAAPDLLEALDWYEQMAKKMQRACLQLDSKAMLIFMQEMAKEGGQKARTAIAKARGAA